MNFSLADIEKAIHKSQHCQRNWDLSKEIPAEDFELLVTAATQCPSKQNVAFYRAHFVTNRALIEQAHDLTDGFTVSYDPPASTTNSQVLANLLVILEAENIDTQSGWEPYRNFETLNVAKGEGLEAEEARSFLLRDQNMAVGVAAGYLNLTASLLGYATGCCACFDVMGIKKLFGLENMPLLLMGIGFRDETRGRRVHHLDSTFVFPTKPKQPIRVNVPR